MIRERLSSDLKSAVARQEADKVATLRLISAAIKDRDLAAKASDSGEGLSDPEIREMLQRMKAQREANAEEHEQAGRFDLAEQERQEAHYIRHYLPRQLSDSEIQEAVNAAIADTGAESVRDISRVMTHLKETHSGRMDFARACSTVKDSFR